MPNVRENDQSDWIQVKHKNSPKTKLTSPVNSITKHNADGILSHSNDPIPDNKTIYIDPPLAQQDADIHEHRILHTHIDEESCFLPLSANETLGPIKEKSNMPKFQVTSRKFFSIPNPHASLQSPKTEEG
jgi:hypothetical protein